MAHTKVTKTHSQNTGTANTFSYSGSFDVFKGTEVIALLDGVNLTFTSSTINESASPREYTVDTTAKTIHIGGADLSSGTITIRPETDMGAPTPRATYTPGASVASEDLNNNQLQLMRKAMEYDEQKLASTGGTMTGDLTLGVGTNIVIEGATDNAYETTLTVTDPTADRTITLPNVTGTVVTTGDTGSVATGMIADDAVTNDKLANSIVSEIAANTAKTTNQTHTGDVTGSVALTIASGAVNSDKIANGAIVNDDVNASAAIAHSKLAAVPDGQIIVGSGSTVPTAVAVSGDITLANDGAVTIANNAVEIGMIGCEQTTISDSDSHIPTSGAVVDYVAAQLAPIGGLEVIADEDNFPTSQPASGVVISIADAAGVVVNGSGVSTTARTAGNGSDNVTINNFPSSLYSETLASGVGLMVTSTGSSNTYNYHKILAAENDVKQLSDDINDFNARYRVNAGEPGSNNDDGDLVFDTNANKMKVYDGSSWGEVTSTGEFKYLFLCPAGGSGAPTLNGSIATYDLREGSNSGTAASVTNAAQLLVSINGVIQKANTGTSAPAEGFALVDANTIIFGANLASGDSIFIIQIGSAVSIPTPGDDTVTSAKIVDGAILNVDINASAAIAGSKLADDSIAEVKLDIHNAPSGTDKFLAYTSNGMEWAVPTDTTVGGSTGVDFNDNVKARFGTGNDLEIYHTGSVSRIQDLGTGGLEITSDGTGVDINKGTSEYMGRFLIDGAVELYHNNVKKIETTSAGVTVTGTVTDTKGDVRSIPSNAQSGAYVAVAADAGKAIYISTGGVTLNDSVFSAGDAVTIINNSGSDQTITQGSGVTMYNTGDASTGNRTLAGRGMATAWFAAANTVYISGSGLS